MKFLCKLGWHTWDKGFIDQMDHRPCYRYHTCKYCTLEERFEGYHRFGNWGDTYYINIRHCIDVIGSHGDFVTESSRQARFCMDCKLKDVRELS